MPLDAPRPEFRPIAPWPAGLRFRDAPTERVIQNLLPPRPDACSYTGSTAGLAVDAEFAEPSGGDLVAQRRAVDAERQRAKRAAARA
jgi:hypothetical protein